MPLVVPDAVGLHTLAEFDVTRARPELATDLGRFAGASAIAELALRFVSDDPSPGLYAAVLGALDGVAAAPPGDTRSATLAGAWRLVAELGFAPAIDVCGLCHAELAPAEPAV